MKLNAVNLLTSLSIVFASVATAATSGSGESACPQGYKLKYTSGFQWNSCECIGEFHHSVPLKHGWTSNAIKGHRGVWACETQFDPAPPKPSATYAAGHPRPSHAVGHSKATGHGKGDHTSDHGGGHSRGKGHGHKGHDGSIGRNSGGKQSHKSNGSKKGDSSGHGYGKLRSESLEACPPNTLTCPIIGSGFGPADVECVYSNEALYNCGACGNSCAAITGVDNAACVSGKCEIHSCASGFKLITNAKGVASCAPRPQPTRVRRRNQAND